MGLGDALKKAGLVGDKDLRRAKREKKRDEVAAGMSTKQDSEQAREAERRARHDAELLRREEQRAQELAREAERRETEAQLRIAQIAEANDLTERAGRFLEPFYFVARDGKVRNVRVSDDMAARLRTGAVGIVERPDGSEPGFAIVDRATVRRIEQIDPDAVRFDNTRPDDDAS